MRISPVNISLMHENGSFQMYERVVHLWNSQLGVVERVQTPIEKFLSPQRGRASERAARKFVSTSLKVSIHQNKVI